MSGYSDGIYADALCELGVPRRLDASDTWILERSIPGSSRKDAMGCYPLFCCGNWEGLPDDLDRIGEEIVALSLVTDPFGEYDPESLRALFPDLMTPFKNHYIVDLQKLEERPLDGHHRRNERKGLANVRVERVECNDTCHADWVRLYSTLMMRHGIRGMAAFSERSLRRQLDVPGTVVFSAVHDGTPVGMTVWYVRGDVGYYHLGAYTDAGYDLRASYALFSTAIEYFARGDLRWLGLGGAAGLRPDESSGLARFKRGWSTSCRVVYLCGRIFDREAYTQLRDAAGKTAGAYFPAYRDGELA